MAKKPRNRGDIEEPEAPGQGPLEGIFQEVIRRGASLGFSSFFLTEEAIRRAFSERVPAEWADYLAEQSEGVRSELVDRMAAEFGNWLRSLDPAEIAADFLAEREVSLRLEIKPKRKSSDAASTEGLRIFKKK